MLIKILRSYLVPYKKLVIASIFLLLIQAMANLYLPNLNADLINYGVAKGDVGYIVHIGLIMLGSSALVVLVSIGNAYLASKTSMSFGRDLRLAVFQKVQSFSSQEMGKFGAPTLITRSTNDVQQIQMVLFMGISMMVAAPITAIGAIFMAIHTNSHLSLLILISVPLLGLVITILLRQIVPLFRVTQKKIDRINLILREQIAGVRVIRAFIKRTEEENRFKTASDDLLATTLKVTRTFAIMMPFLFLILNASSVAVIWFGGKLINDGKMQIGSLTAFLAYLMQILANVMMAVMMSMMIPRATASAERVQEILSTKSSIDENSSAFESENHQGKVEFRDVEFRYPGAEHPILSGITFSAKPGAFNAIIGSTGSGKSTLLNMIPRFMDASKGEVLIDGINVRDYRLESLWTHIGLVPQRSILFKGTIRENLKFGNNEASDETIWKALEVAQAIDFIEALPEKLDAEVSQGGSNFSGGQRQRLAITRALVRNPQIYILDDSFSALDYETDAKLRNELSKFAKNATLIVVAQRVSTILNADQIIVLNEGKIAGIGKHHELMENCETYKEIVLSQLSPEEAA
ncbi:MAG: hypothetical protein RL129_820 [Actinomycetota bacterium]|jgi:ATP-binding cassette subfamily B protein